MNSRNVFFSSICQRLSHLDASTRLRIIGRIMEDMDKTDILVPLYKSFPSYVDKPVEVNEFDQREKLIAIKQTEYESLLGPSLDGSDDGEQVSNDRWGRSPLHEAVLQNDLDAVKKLIGEGADHKARDNNGHTPVQLAFLEERNEIIGYFRSISAV